MSADKIPAFTWGAAFANTLNIGYPLDNPLAYDKPRDGSEQRRAGATVDAWITGTDEILEGDIRYIPGSNTTNPTATGYDGATGFKAFLEWMRDGNAGRFIPDKDTPGTYHTVYLLEPFSNSPQPEGDGTYRVRIVILDNGSTGAFTGYALTP